MKKSIILFSLALSGALLTGIPIAEAQDFFGVSGDLNDYVPVTPINLPATGSSWWSSPLDAFQNTLNSLSPDDQLAYTSAFTNPNSPVSGGYAACSGCAQTRTNIVNFVNQTANTIYNALPSDASNNFMYSLTVADEDGIVGMGGPMTGSGSYPSLAESAIYNLLSTPLGSQTMLTYGVDALHVTNLGSSCSSNLNFTAVPPANQVNFGGSINCSVHLPGGSYTFDACNVIDLTTGFDAGPGVTLDATIK